MDWNYLFYPIIIMLRLALHLSTLVDLFQRGIIFVWIFQHFHNYFSGLFYEIVQWYFWLPDILFRFLIAKCWWIIVSLFLPVFQPWFLIFEFLPSTYYSSKGNSLRNSIQSTQSKRNCKSSNYNFYHHCYMTDFPLHMQNMNIGIFTSTYSVYPWWSMFLIRHHIMPHDVKILSLFHTIYWNTYDFLTIPYTYLQSKPKRPPDGFIFNTLVFFLLICVSIMTILYSILTIFLVRTGLIIIHNSSQTNITETTFLDKPDPKYAVFTSISVLTAESLANHQAFASFDSNIQTALVDNCANTHIWTERSQFINFRNIPKTQQGVSTIGGTPHLALGIGDVPLTWKDDDGLVFSHTLRDVLYFPNSPVRIINTSKLKSE